MGEMVRICREGRRKSGRNVEKGGGEGVGKAREGRYGERAEGRDNKGV